MQTEMAWRVGGKPVTNVFIPAPSTLVPTVALVAFRHSRALIATGLDWPNHDWPSPSTVCRRYARTSTAATTGPGRTVGCTGTSRFRAMSTGTRAASTTGGSSR